MIMIWIQVPKEIDPFHLMKAFAKGKLYYLQQRIYLRPSSDKTGHQQMKTNIQSHANQTEEGMEF